MAAGKPKDHAGYIAAAPGFARPILRRVASLWRKAAPKAQPIMKWNAPHFEGGSLLGGMAAFKAHCSFTLWNARAIQGAEKYFPAGGRMPMGTLKVGSVDELPSDATLVKIFREAAKLDAAGEKGEMKKAPRLVTPKDFREAMKGNAKAAATYEALTTGRKREYCDWIEEAKRQATREKRIATAVEWLSEGKEKNWKYRDC